MVNFGGDFWLTHSIQLFGQVLVPMLPVKVAFTINWLEVKKITLDILMCLLLILEDFKSKHKGFLRKEVICPTTVVKFLPALTFCLIQQYSDLKLQPV